MQHRIFKLDQKIDKKIAKFNTRLLKKKVNKYGSISKQEFWKLKRTLIPKSSTVPYAVIDKYGNEVNRLSNGGWGWVMEVPKSTSIAALFLELGILPLQYEIEKRQLVFLKRILDWENDHPIKMSYHEMLKYQAERNWANNVHELRGK